jgi:hypothetical protein
LADSYPLLAASPSLALWRLRLKYFLPKKASITPTFNGVSSLFDFLCRKRHEQLREGSGLIPKGRLDEGNDDHFRVMKTRQPKHPNKSGTQ